MTDAATPQGAVEMAILAFTTFFATIGPIDVAAMYAALTPHVSPRARRSMAVRGTLLATGILLAFAFLGQSLLHHLGITLPALRTAGGVLLLLIGIEMVFARSSGGTSTTDAENREAEAKSDITVFPLATPLIAGPGAMGAVVLLMASTGGDLRLRSAVLAALLACLGLTLACLLGASWIQRLLGVTGMHVVSRVFGVVLCALAVQFVFDGIRGSGLIPGAAAERPAVTAPAPPGSRPGR